MNTTIEAPPAIAMDAVDSHNIHSIGYDAGTGVMAVRFKSFAKKDQPAEPTALYHYDHVTPDIHQQIKARTVEDSVTKTFNALVKSHPVRFPYTKIESAPGVPVIQIGATDVS